MRFTAINFADKLNKGITRFQRSPLKEYRIT
jgi:hypothetical protein